MLRRSQLCLHVDSVARPTYFHSAASLLAQRSKFRGKESSRSRLTKSLILKPGTRSANLEVAPYSGDSKVSRDKSRSRKDDSPLDGLGRLSMRTPREASGGAKLQRTFERDPLPHSDPNAKPLRIQEERNVSFRRRSRRADKPGERTGRWRTEMANTDSKNLTKENIKLPHNIISELSDYSTNTTTTHQDPDQLPAKFTSPPLMPGLLSCLMETLGPRATPTPIQALSLKWLLNDGNQATNETGWKQFLLASETGSGKSIAYLLPLLQNLKQSELGGRASVVPPGPRRPLNPRALVLAPTHELSRQLSGFAKSLLHEVKLRVLCASRANSKNTQERDATARQMVSQFGMRADNEQGGEFELKDRSGFPVDVVVGTPMKLLEMVKGRGWDRREMGADGESADKPNLDFGHKLRRGRDKMVGFGKWRSQPEMGLENVEWVVVDEADVLFDPDFQETTRQLLADISLARGRPVVVSHTFSPPSATTSASSPSSSPKTLPVSTPIDYPFNLILTSATIPSALAAYLDTYHPKLMRLASPRLHHLPKTLQTEYVHWTGGNKLADIERRIRRVWSEDASLARATKPVDSECQGDSNLSKVLIFCNRSSKVGEMGQYLEERGIKNVALSSTSEQRKRGSNHHLDGFLRSSEDLGAKDIAENGNAKPEKPVVATANANSDPSSAPHVMITTSLLSRGLDFSPTIKHVFIVDEPRNMIDFLHRAGRAGRAGEKGKVVIFGKLKGRGSASAKDVRKKVGSLLVH